MPLIFKYLKEYNIQILDLITNDLSDMLWVKDLEGKYLFVNQSICDNLLMTNSLEEAIGKDDSFFANRERNKYPENKEWHTFGNICNNSDFEVIKENKTMKFEEYGFVKGEIIYLEVSKSPIYNNDGNVIGTIGSARNITEFKNTQKKLEDTIKELDLKTQELNTLSFIDHLTQIPNKLQLEECLKKDIKESNNLSLLFIDIDNFKDINDSFGHDFGDLLLIQVAKRLRTCLNLKNNDLLSRFGGDEFAIIVRNPNNIDYYIKHIIKTISEKYFILNRELIITVSIGAAFYPSDADTFQDLMKKSDSAMYQSKKLGKNTYSFYNDEMTKKSFERVLLENSLKQSLIDDNFVVFYQPQVNSLNNTVVGMEALIRWEHPEIGLIQPNNFIPLSEELGLIIQLDRIVMDKSIKQFSLWKKQGIKCGKLSLNLSVKQIHSSDFIDYFKSIITKYDFDIKLIEFEITESLLMENINESIKILNEIKKLGVSLSVDDFGTGYSSLSYLKKLPISKLKIDREFVKDLPNDKDDIAISKSIIQLSNNLELEVIAEGVENKEQILFLNENNCFLIQGYHYSKPKNAQDIELFLKKLS